MEVRILEGLTLLVVDDDELLRKRIVAHLDRCGADVMGVGTVEETRRTLTGMDFDFALLDIHLPDGSGLELLRQRVFPSGMGVIVMTVRSKRKI